MKPKTFIIWEAIYCGDVKRIACVTLTWHCAMLCCCILDCSHMTLGRGPEGISSMYSPLLFYDMLFAGRDDDEVMTAA